MNDDYSDWVDSTEGQLVKGVVLMREIEEGASEGVMVKDFIEWVFYNHVDRFDYNHAREMEALS